MSCPSTSPTRGCTPVARAFAGATRRSRSRVPGHHNALNAVAALEASRLAGADPARAAAALADFRAAGRRFERLGATAAGAEVYDDYAHHPTEVRATLEAARTLRPRRLVAVFQPHLYSRTAALAGEFGRALALADLVVVLEIYRARERPEDHPGVTGLEVAEATADRAAGREVAWLPRFEDAERYLRDVLREGDLCLVIGAGERRRARAPARRLSGVARRRAVGNGPRPSNLRAWPRAAEGPLAFSRGGRPAGACRPAHARRPSPCSSSPWAPGASWSCATSPCSPCATCASPGRPAPRRRASPPRCAPRPPV